MPVPEPEWMGRFASARSGIRDHARWWAIERYSPAKDEWVEIWSQSANEEVAEARFQVEKEKFPDDMLRLLQKHRWVEHRHGSVIEQTTDNVEPMRKWEVSSQIMAGTSAEAIEIYRERTGVIPGKVTFIE